MSTLGEKIRSLRHEKKLTLVQLAGNKMTKGMLSLIENNKATPSMENLTYIAEQLNVSVAELLDDHLEKEDKLLHTIKHILKNEQTFEKNAKSIWQLYNPDRSLSDQLSGAQLAVYFGKSAYYMKKPMTPFFNHAETVYKSLHATDLWIDTVFERVRLLINDQLFEDSLQFLNEKKEELNTFSVQPTPMRLLEWYFYLASTQLALGLYDEGMETIEESLALSKQHHVYYMTNQLLRMGTAVGMMMTYRINTKGYFEKLKQYMLFSEDEDLHVYLPYIETHYYTTVHINLERAKNIMSKIDINNAPDIYIPFLYLERGKILYYQHDYEQALQTFEKIVSPELPYHPIDKSVLASRYTFMLKIAQQTNDEVLLQKALNQGKQIYDTLPDSFYKKQFFNTFHEK